MIEEIEEKLMKQSDTFVDVAECSLDDDEHRRAIATGKCLEKERLGDDRVNRYALFLRTDNHKFCYRYHCPHRKQAIHTLFNFKHPYEIELTTDEMERVDKLIEVTECGLGWKELASAIKQHDCHEEQKLGKDLLDFHSMFMREGGITLCEGFDCPNKRDERHTLYDFKHTPSLGLSEEEEEYLKRHDWEFIADDDWIKDNMFYPRPKAEGDDSERRWFGKKSVPIKEPSEIDVGDVIVFHEWNSREEDGELRTDRFVEFVEDMMRSTPSSLPVGYIVKHPDNVEEEWDGENDD